MGRFVVAAGRCSWSTWQLEGRAEQASSWTSSLLEREAPGLVGVVELC